MFQLSQCLGFNLPDTFARNTELLANFFERVIGIHADSEAHAQHAFFPRGQAGQNASHGFLQVRLNCRIDRNDRIFIFDEITEMRIFFVANWGFERNRFLGNFQSARGPAHGGTDGLCGPAC